MIRRMAKRAHSLFSTILFDPLTMVAKWRALPHFLTNWVRYRRLAAGGPFGPRLRDVHYSSYSRYLSAGSAVGHYFHQDLWAARTLHEAGVTEHVDVGSRIDGFVAHILPFCRVRFVDLRPLKSQVDGLEFVQGSVLDLPLEDSSVGSVSCLHVIEHIGLGRYGDPVDPKGHLKAAAELARVLAPGGRLLIGTPVGRERLCFDAHRVFDPQTIVSAFGGLRLASFALIDDAGRGIIADASFDSARGCEFGCGLFVFEKPQEG